MLTKMRVMSLLHRAGAVLVAHGAYRNWAARHAKERREGLEVSERQTTSEQQKTTLTQWLRSEHALPWRWESESRWALASALLGVLAVFSLPLPWEMSAAEQSITRSSFGEDNNQFSF